MVPIECKDPTEDKAGPEEEKGKLPDSGGGAETRRWPFPWPEPDIVRSRGILRGREKGLKRPIGAVEGEQPDNILETMGGVFG